MTIGGGLGGTLKELRKKATKKRKEGYHCYAVGYKWKDQKRPQWYKNIAVAKNKDELFERLTDQYNIPKDMIVLKRLN